jgi:amphi-Trp domain-containing protein
METGKIEVKQTLPYKEAVRYLEDLVASLKEGTIVVSREQEHVTLTPAETVGIELSAKTKKGKAKFSLELSWAEECASGLSIGSTVPEVPEAAEAAGEAEGEAAQEEGSEDDGSDVGSDDPDPAPEALTKPPPEPEAAPAAERQPAAGKAAPKKTATKKAGPKKAAARKAPAKRGK